MHAKAESSTTMLRFPAPIAFLMERQGTPYSPTTCRTMARGIRSAASLEDLTLAKVRHEQGTRLIDLLTHGAVTQLGRSTVAEFLEIDCGLDVRRAYEWIRFADRVTAREAEQLQYSRCLAAIAVVDLLGGKSITDLVGRDLPWIDADGQERTTRFDADTPVSVLDAVADHLRDKARPARTEPTRSTARRMRLLSETLDRHLERDEDLADLRPRLTIYAGQVRLQHAPMSKPAHFASMARLCSALAKF